MEKLPQKRIEEILKGVKVGDPLEVVVEGREGVSRVLGYLQHSHYRSGIGFRDHRPEPFRPHQFTTVYGANDPSRKEPLARTPDFVIPYDRIVGINPLSSKN